jgi:hypothetical protein
MNKLEKWLLEKLGSDQEPNMAYDVDMSYECKDSKGNIKSIGYKKVDFWGNIHLIQKDGNGKKIAETISRQDGTLAEAIKWDAASGKKISHRKWEKG